MNGVININKPEGMTSQDVCARLKKRLKIRKIGHTGTLDPMATGVLPVCIGKATRIIEYYDKDEKSYHAAMKLGMRSDTLDITGEILETCDYSNVTENAVIEAFRRYTGHIKQTPPKYSALKVDGKRAYELAREGKDFELEAREVEIYANEINALDLREGVIEFDVTCSKGTYIRSICDDIGRELGCGAVMTALERTASGYFTINNALDLEEVLEMSDDEVAKCVIPMENTLTKLGMVLLDNNRVTAFINGNATRPGGFAITEETQFDNLYRVYANERFIGIGSINEEGICPVKVINADN